MLCRRRFASLLSVIVLSLMLGVPGAQARSHSKQHSRSNERSTSSAVPTKIFGSGAEKHRDHDERDVGRSDDDRHHAAKNHSDDRHHADKHHSDDEHEQCSGEHHKGDHDGQCDHEESCDEDHDSDDDDCPVTTPVSVTISTPLDGALLADSAVTVTGTVSGTIPIAVQVNGLAATVTGGAYSASLNLAEGLNVISAEASDASGVASASVTVDVDMIAPVVTIDAPADGSLTTSAQVTVSGTVADAHPPASVVIVGQDVPLAGGSFSTTLPLTLDALNTLTVAATDLAGNTGSDSVGITHGYPPTVQIEYPGDGFLTNQTHVVVTGTVTGSQSPSVEVNGVPAQVMGSSFSVLVDLAEGANSLVVNASNAFGSATDSKNVELDTSRPEVVILTPANGLETIAASAVVSGTVRDNNPIVEFRVNGNAFPLANGAFSGAIALQAIGEPLASDPNTPSNGVNRITAQAVDAAGNTGEMTVWVARGFAPTLTISEPPGGTLVDTPFFDVTGLVTFTDAVEVNGVVQSVIAQPSPPAPYTVPQVPLQEGTNTLVARAANRYGETTASLVVTLDTKPPTIAFSSPVDGIKTADAEIQVVGTVLDASPIASFELNGAPVALNGNSFSVLLPLVEGSNEFVATATDALGHEGTGRIHAIRGSPPVVHITSPASGAFVGSSTVLVTGTAPGANQVLVNQQPAVLSGDNFSITLTLANLGGGILEPISALASNDFG